MAATTPARAPWWVVALGLPALFVALGERPRVDHGRAHLARGHDRSAGPSSGGRARRDGRPSGRRSAGCSWPSGSCAAAACLNPDGPRLFLGQLPDDQEPEHLLAAGVAAGRFQQAGRDAVGRTSPRWPRCSWPKLASRRAMRADRPGRATDVRVLAGDPAARTGAVVADRPVAGGAAGGVEPAAGARRVSEGGAAALADASGSGSLGPGGSRSASSPSPS